MRIAPPKGISSCLRPLTVRRCQHCQEAINVREMTLVLDAYTDEEIAAEGEETGRLLCDDDDTDHDFGE